MTPATLLGFGLEALRGLPARCRLVLELCAAWSLAAFLACAALTLRISEEAVHRRWPAWTAAVVVALTLVLLHRYLISATGLPMGSPPGRAADWRPSRLRLLLFGVLFALFSQLALVVLAGKLTGGTDQIQAAEASRAGLHSALRQRLLAQRDAENARSVAELSEHLRQSLAQQRLLHAGSEATAPEADSRDSLAVSVHRKALLFGNEGYPGAALNNPRKDASDLGHALQEMGYQVTLILDADRATMETAIGRFVQSIGPQDISLFYFSGHGFQEGGSNYLVPLDLKSPEPAQAVNASIVTERISQRGPLVNLIILDACRSFVRPDAQHAGGLAASEVGINTYLALPARPGQSALDGPRGTNSLFTAALLDHIHEVADIDSIFREVRTEVAEQTRGRQETWTVHNLTDTFLLAAADSPAARRQGSVPMLQERGGRCAFDARLLGREAALRLRIQCLRGALMKVRDDGMTVRAESASLLTPPPAAATGTALELLAYDSLWTHTLRSVAALLASVLLVALFGAGLIVQEHWPEALRAYEAAKVGFWNAEGDAVRQGFRAPLRAATEAVLRDWRSHSIRDGWAAVADHGIPDPVRDGILDFGERPAPVTGRAAYEQVLASLQGGSEGKA